MGNTLTAVGCKAKCNSTEAAGDHPVKNVILQTCIVCQKLLGKKKISTNVLAVLLIKLLIYGRHLYMMH